MTELNEEYLGLLAQATEIAEQLDTAISFKKIFLRTKLIRIQSRLDEVELSIDHEINRFKYI